ncbi:DNA translocase FtsK 4TM domain-containing protein [Candidatus Nomurabacteria bacterium]|jgi:S-DNA-T family DNA segregation ATPase FtsK/SpoIIIE|nr:MAG: DNA translocase FtsK 4TM domain-containing protein [Candidatus Nomurabacteria bacterium]
MAKKNTKKETSTKKTKDDTRGTTSTALKQETRYGVYAIIAFAGAVFFLLSLFHIAGVAGNFIYTILFLLLGVGYYLLPIVCAILGFSFLQTNRPNIALTHTIGVTLFFISLLGMIHVLSSNPEAGGYIGNIVSWPFLKLFDTYVSILFLSAVLIISLFVLFDTRPNIAHLRDKFRSFRNTDEDEENIVSYGTEAPVAIVPEVIKPEEITGSAPEVIPQREEELNLGEKLTKPRTDLTYVPPPLSLLEKDQGKPNVGDIKANANIIQRTLANFGIIVEMDEITIGPTVTRYALKPAQGVKLSRIAGLQNDLALALAAHPIRMELPIPGKSLVGIEIPNKTKATISLGSLLGDTQFTNAQKPLFIALGRNVAGRAMYINLAKAPHALIAGTTGSGKSVTIHALINSLLYRNSPEDLKFIMVDPKRVELTLYNKIPHLLTPVITEAKKCILALKWAAKEMDRRYDILQSHSVRDIESYHANIYSKKSAGGTEDRMPYIVVIIDELADIMQSYPRELEAAIVRLAQMSRAVGIHLVLSTQRPEVNIITGLIKANVPTRIALRVPTQIDSRTILDSGGAEKLLGAGDMLFSGGEGQPERLQSAFISENEVKKIVKYLSDAYKDEVTEDIALSGPIAESNSIFSATLDDEANEEDELYEEARQIVIESGKASTSYLQRKLGVGYSRAAKLIDMLEEHSVVGAANGAKPREVLEKNVTVEKQEYV